MFSIFHCHIAGAVAVAERETQTGGRAPHIEALALPYTHTHTGIKSFIRFFSNFRCAFLACRVRGSTRTSPAPHEDGSRRAAGSWLSLFAPFFPFSP